MDRAKKSYTDSLRKALEARESFQPQSHEVRKCVNKYVRISIMLNLTGGVRTSLLWTLVGQFLKMC